MWVAVQFFGGPNRSEITRTNAAHFGACLLPNHSNMREKILDTDGKYALRTLQFHYVVSHWVSGYSKLS